MMRVKMYRPTVNQYSAGGGPPAAAFAGSYKITIDRSMQKIKSIKIIPCLEMVLATDITLLDFIVGFADYRLRLNMANNFFENYTYEINEVIRLDIAVFSDGADVTNGYVTGTQFFEVKIEYE